MADENVTIPTTTVPAVPAAAAAAPAAPGPSMVPISLEQLQAFTATAARLAAIETENRAREAQVEADKAAAAIKRGELEQGLSMLKKTSDDLLASERAKLAATEERTKRYALDGELARVLASQPLVAGGAEQLTQLWRSQFTVEAAGDSFTVRTPTFQSVADFVAAQLALPTYAHFVRAQNPGGGTGGSSSGSQTVPTPGQTAPPETPKTLSDAIILNYKQQLKEGGGDGRTDPSVGFGLRRKG